VDEEGKRNRPRRNAPMPARYIQRIYSVENSDAVDVCCRDDSQEVEGFAAEEVRPEEDNRGPGEDEIENVDQVKVAGHAFRAARLQLPLGEDSGKTIGKMCGALRGVWMEAIPRVYGIDREQKGPVEPLSGKGFGSGPGPVGKAKGGLVKGENVERAGKVDGVAESGMADRIKVGRKRAGKKVGGECYLHGPFLGDMLPDKCSE